VIQSDLTETAEFSHCMHAACSRVSESAKQPPAGTHSSSRTSSQARPAALLTKLYIMVCGTVWPINASVSATLATAGACGLCWLVMGRRGGRALGAAAAAAAAGRGAAGGSSGMSSRSYSKAAAHAVRCRRTVWYPSAPLRPTPLSARHSADLWRVLEWPEKSRRVGVGVGGTGAAALPDAPAPFALVLLNTEEGCSYLQPGEGGSPSAALLSAMWDHAAVIVVADGAANHLHDSAAGAEQQQRGSDPAAQRLPHFIAGDLDSIRPEVREFYARRGVEIAERPSQDSHDFEKSLILAKQQLDEVRAWVAPWLHTVTTCHQ
jgi:hypothetical protein